MIVSPTVCVTSTPFHVLAVKARSVASVRGVPRGGGSMEASPALNTLTAAGDERKAGESASPKGRDREKARAGGPRSDVIPSTPGVR